MTAPHAVDPAQVDEVMGRLLSDIAATAGLQMIQIGFRTGLWKAMAHVDPITPEELATRAGVAVPYVREWLRHQAASGYVQYEGATGRFTLTDAAAAVLTDRGQVGMVEGFAQMLGAMVRDNVLVEEAFRTGAGVGWDQRSAEHWHGMDLATRSAVVPALVSEWVPALDGVEDRLRAGGTVADVGCGYGAALIALAQQFPESRLHGFDYHDGSIACARKAADEAGVAASVAFDVADATAYPAEGYDLVTFVDTLHDLGDPLGALRHAWHAVAADGVVLLVEFGAADRLEDNFSPMGRLLFASSALVCSPNAVSQGATEPLGTAAGPARLTDLAHAAGFSRVRQLPVGMPFSLLLELRR